MGVDGPGHRPPQRLNENVYTGWIARGLLQDNLNLFKICHWHTGVMIPLTCWSRSALIDGIFATPGIKCVNVMILPHYGGVSDHKCFIIDLFSPLVIGTLFPNIVQCAARKLHCKGSQMVSVYNKELTRLCEEHNMFHHMDEILHLCDYLNDNNFLLLVNGLDEELEECMLHAETYCSKFMMGHIEWSPVIGMWLSR
jgi:hypothetical protein